jgi:hypothetical protein
VGEALDTSEEIARVGTILANGPVRPERRRRGDAGDEALRLINLTGYIA